MEGGIISNQQITASSTHRALFGLQKWYPYFARLNKKGLVNAWTAAENDRWPWIQVKHSHSADDNIKVARIEIYSVTGLILIILYIYKLYIYITVYYLFCENAALQLLIVVTANLI